MFDLTFTKEHKHLLQDQVIDLDHPGSILRDFQMLLDFVGPLGVKAAGKYNLLPIDTINTLDERLHRPLHLSMERPLLRSHPYLMGLHLLLRATGLTKVEGKGSKARLVVDPLVVESWNSLNPTERYFNLLEAGLLFGQPEMVGEKGSRVNDKLLLKCLEAWHFLPAEGQQASDMPYREIHLQGIYREFYLVALMDLFGLIAVAFPKKPAQPWIPAKVQHVPFGDALFTLLARAFRPMYFALSDRDTEEPALDQGGGSAEAKGVAQDSEDEDDVEELGGGELGQLQRLLQPYFPEWQNNLRSPEQDVPEGDFVFRVSLGNVWRRIAIDSEATLAALASVILKSMAFDADHLYEFRYRDRFGGTVHVGHPFDRDGLGADEVVIGMLPLQPGQSITFLYDFGDTWEFTVELERIEPTTGRARKPRILEKHGQSPEQYPQ